MSHLHGIKQLSESETLELASAALTQLAEMALGNNNTNKARGLQQLSHELSGTSTITTPDPEDEYAGIDQHPYSANVEII